MICSLDLFFFVIHGCGYSNNCAVRLLRSVSSCSSGFAWAETNTLKFGTSLIVYYPVRFFVAPDGKSFRPVVRGSTIHSSTQISFEIIYYGSWNFLYNYYPILYGWYPIDILCRARPSHLQEEIHSLLKLTPLRRLLRPLHQLLTKARSARLAPE